MSGWEEFKNDAGKIISKAAVKAGEITDAATARIKLEALRLKLCEEYEKLGRLTYKARRESVDLQKQTDEIIFAIDKLRADVRRAQKDINARREAAERRARERAEEAAGTAETSTDTADDINPAMDSAAAGADA